MDDKIEWDIDANLPMYSRDLKKAGYSIVPADPVCQHCGRPIAYAYTSVDEFWFHKDTNLMSCEFIAMPKAN